MKTSLRATCVCVVVIMTVAAEPERAAAQISIGGLNQQSNGGDDDENRGNNSNQGSRRSRSSRNSTNKNGGNTVDGQIQQFFPGSGSSQKGNSSGQNVLNHDGDGRFNRSNQPGNFQGNRQFDNWNQGNNTNITIGGWNAGKWQGSRSVNDWTKQFGGNQQPFSSQWYKDHPKAWQYDNNNNNANIYIGGTLPGLYGWLGWGNVPQQYRNYYGNNVPQFDRSYYGQWYPLGVFSLLAGPGDSGTRMVQLAVDQRGRIAGNYYDMITGSNYSVSGDVSRQNQRASFSLNKNQFVHFRAPIYELLQPSGRLTVTLPGGNQQWQFVRMEN